MLEWEASYVVQKVMPVVTRWTVTQGTIPKPIQVGSCVKCIWRKEKKVFWALMDFENGYDRIARKYLWDVLRLYGLVGRLLSGVKISM